MTSPTFYISIIDIERGKFPSNFVCKLPKNPSALINGKGFARIFAGSDRVSLAIQLLTDSLSELTSGEFKLEVEKRINLLITSREP